jgi:hypothetical protein
VSADQEKEVLEPEVLPPERGPYGTGPRPGSRRRRAQGAFGPILAGFLLDLVDLGTLGPSGLILGGLSGYWIASMYDLPFRQRILLALGVGFYAMIPGTNFLPLATLIGAVVRFRDGARGPRSFD